MLFSEPTAHTITPGIFATFNLGIQHMVSNGCWYAFTACAACNQDNLTTRMKEEGHLPDVVLHEWGKAAKKD